MDRASPTFLYIEDDLLSRRIVEILLKDLMAFPDVTIIDNTSNFLEKLHALPAVPNVIFLDIRMRPLDGYQVLTMLRSEPLYADVAIIALTANVMANDVEHLKRAGFSGLIGKPIMKEIFPELVEKILAGESVWYIP
jgi:CheY-like chemotaxis protein